MWYASGSDLILNRIPYPANHKVHISLLTNRRLLFLLLIPQNHLIHDIRPHGVFNSLFDLIARVEKTMVLKYENPSGLGVDVYLALLVTAEE